MFFASYFSFRTFAQFCNAICRKLIDTSSDEEGKQNLFKLWMFYASFKRGLGNCWRMKMKNSVDKRAANGAIAIKIILVAHTYPGIHIVYCSFPYYHRFSTHTSHPNAYEQSSLQGRKILEKSISVGAAFSLLSVMQFHSLSLSHANKHTYTFKICAWFTRIKIEFFLWKTFFYSQSWCCWATK